MPPKGPKPQQLSPLEQQIEAVAVKQILVTSARHCLQACLQEAFAGPGKPAHRTAHGAGAALASLMPMTARTVTPMAASRPASPRPVGRRVLCLGTTWAKGFESPDDRFDMTVSPFSFTSHSSLPESVPDPPASPRASRPAHPDERVELPPSPQTPKLCCQQPPATAWPDAREPWVVPSAGAGDAAARRDRPRKWLGDTSTTYGPPWPTPRRPPHAPGAALLRISAGAMVAFKPLFRCLTESSLTRAPGRHPDGCSKGRGRS